jgi:hypothetical protein
MDSIAWMDERMDGWMNGWMIYEEGVGSLDDMITHIHFFFFSLSLSLSQ